MGDNKYENIDSIVSSLPSGKGWIRETAYKYEGFWFEKEFLRGILTAQISFEPQPNSVVLATFPKCGTTWFASLLYTTINRSSYGYSSHPLLTCTPQNCLTWIEFNVLNKSPAAKVSTLRPLLKTHTPYTLLPNSIKGDNQPIVYVFRDPKDVFVSLWFFANMMRPQDLSRLGLEEAFNLFCQGECSFGSYWDNALSYWRASLERPGKVLFLRYEDMKDYPIDTLKKLAEFVGFPFSLEEEKDGVIQEIVSFCSFDNLKNLPVNQDTNTKMYFRKGKVGDHKSYLTDEMIKCLKEITEAKFKGSGLNACT